MQAGHQLATQDGTKESNHFGVTKRQEGYSCWMNVAWRAEERMY